MAMNRIQFQAGLSMAAFFERYGTEALCTAALPIASSMAVSARCFSATPAASNPRSDWFGWLRSLLIR